MDNFRLADLIDLPAVQKMADAHYQAAGMPIGIIDAIDDSILVGVGWQDICVKFHRSNPKTLKRCHASDNYIKEHLESGQACHYKCKNGLWDIGIPIIVARCHLATMFLGQFFYQGEAPDREFFVRQAREFGFDHDDYLAALDRVPVFEREKVKYILEYNKALVGFIIKLAENSLAKLKADEAVLRQQYFLRKAQEIGRIGTWELDIRTDECIWTDETHKIFGIPKGTKITYETILNCVYPDDREFVDRKWKASLKGEPFDVEHRLLVDGKIKWVRVRAEFENGENVKFTRRIGVTQDITAKKQAEEALRESEERFRGLVESSSDWIWEVNAEGIYTYASPNVEEILGYRPEEVVGKSPFDLMLLEDSEQIAKIFFDSVIQGKPLVALENVNLHKDGRSIVLETNAVPFFDSVGKLQGYRGVDRDITQRRRSEEKIRKLNESLEQRVAKRTAELESRTQQLQQLALELAGAEDRERRQIASILHDDFQQELAFIKMELDQVRKHPDPEIAQRLGLLSKLTGECIEKSRNLSYEINPPVLHRNGLLVALDVLVNDMKREHGLTVTYRKQKGAEPIFPSLASILYRSARELLLNVVKHAGVESALLDVRCRSKMIYLKVEDRGNGFDFDAVKVGQGSGTGFGLYNIEDRMTSLGGSMKVNSKPSSGCCVVLKVPKDVSRKGIMDKAPFDSIVQELVRSVPSEPIYPIAEKEQIRVLLVDDHQLLREALARMLHSQKELTIVGQAVNGREAVQLAAKLKPDVILMDVTMPEIDGFEATAQITRDNPDLHIIGLSMHNDPDTRQKMFEVGASAYLSKTDAPDTVVETILKLYGSSRSV